MLGNGATMRAAVYRGERTVVVEDVPVPSLEPGQVLEQVSHCGICGTDLHLMMEDWGWPGFTGGHEYSGVVVSVGQGVTGWSVGDRVVGGPRPGCGECPLCLSGHSNLCTARVGPGRAPTARGGFAEYKVLDTDALYGIPDGMDLRPAALTEPVAVALRGVRRSGIGPGARALVTGAGPGTLLLSGTGMVRPGLDVNRVILHELNIAGTVEYTPGDFRDALGLLASGQLPTHLLIEPEHLNLDGLRAGMQQLMAGELAGKVMVAPSARPN